MTLRIDSRRIPAQSPPLSAAGDSALERWKRRPHRKRVLFTRQSDEPTRKKKRNQHRSFPPYRRIRSSVLAIAGRFCSKYATGMGLVDEQINQIEWKNRECCALSQRMTHGTNQECEVFPFFLVTSRSKGLNSKYVSISTPTFL